MKSVARRVAGISLVLYTLLQFALIWLSIASLLTSARYGATVYASILLIAAPAVLVFSYIIAFLCTVDRRDPPYARVVWDVADFTFSGIIGLFFTTIVALRHLLMEDDTLPASLDTMGRETNKTMHAVALIIALFMFDVSYDLIHGWMFNAYPLRVFTMSYVNSPHQD